jgi:acyl carrier protein
LALGNFSHEIQDMSNDLKEKVFEVLVEVFPSINSHIDYDSGPNEISEWDSMNHLTLIMELNNKFNIEIEFEDVLHIDSVGNIFTVLRKYIDNE